MLFVLDVVSPSSAFLRSPSQFCVLLVPGTLFASSLLLQLCMRLIHLVFLAGLRHAAIVRSARQAIFKDFTVLEWGPSLAQASTEGPLCLLPNSPVNP